MTGHGEKPGIAARLGALDARKRIASLFLLPQCDMSCRFCASETSFSVMTFAQAETLLRGLSAVGLRNVVFGGGEPCRWPHDLDRLCSLARDLGFLVQLCTNGVALDEGFEQATKVDRYILPLEAMDPALHDRLRVHSAGHHNTVLSRLNALACSKTEVSISTVVTRENADELARIADYLSAAVLRGLALHAWHLYRFLPVGRGGRSRSNALAIPRQTFFDACAAARRRSRGYAVYRRDNMLRSSSVEFFWFEGQRLQIGSTTRTAVNASPRAETG